jgi:glucose-6-phosphate 1-epimerase
MELLPDGARLEKASGGLDRLVLDATESEAVVYLHGAHVAHFHPKGGRPVLWMSLASRFETGKPIRGGVPICFPWFGRKAGSPDAPQHGFARILPWTIVDVTREADLGLRALFELRPETAARAGFATGLQAALAVTVSRSLRMELTVRNLRPAAATFEEALHSYFAVSDVRQVRVHGLEGIGYLDTAGGGRESRPGEAEPITISGETDRAYTGTTGTVTIEDPGWRRRIVVAKQGSATTVVWNPWIAKAKAMPDFGDDEWAGMICVETANALDDAIHLAAGDSHVMTATIDVEGG